MDVKYKIRMLSDWHCGSGLDTGSEADLLVIKDEYGLPFIPGKTIKGLLKDALMDMVEVKKVKQEDVDIVFGTSVESETKPGSAWFSNAVLSGVEDLNEDLIPYLYRNISSTAIGDRGVVLEKSLRTMEVCVPVELQGTIVVENEKDRKLLAMAMKWVRYLGSGRNRGLGRCKWELLDAVKL